MTLFESLGALATASGDGAVDWDAVSSAARASMDPGDLDVGPAERAGFASDVRDARRAIAATTGRSFAISDAVEVQHRHHWIDANVETFRLVLAPLDETPTLLPGLANRVNTATMATLLAVLGRNVLGQYDPRLFAEGDPGLYFVLPNLRRAAAVMNVDHPRFRRWIAFHEVTHAAEFDAAPWLVPHLEDRIERAVGGLAEGDLDAAAVRDVDDAMTAVEGYAEFVMDRAFDARTDDLRERLDARRRAGGPLAALVRRLLGLGIKRRQYERGKAFFDAVADARGVEAAGAVWREPAALPTSSEFEQPAQWLSRVEP